MFEEIAKSLLGQHGYTERTWAMSMAERCALACLLSARKPSVSIEIGTFGGGSLSIISNYSGKAFSLDIDATPSVKLAGCFDNVEFITGDSQVELPKLVNRISGQGEDLEFVLIDGDHTAEGVRKDIEAVLQYSLKTELLVLMHDSFNPDCRSGMKAIDWAGNPHVHWIDFDFVPGFLSSIPGWEDQMWGGFALAVLRPEPREGDLEQGELLGRQFDKLLPVSVHCG